MNELPPARPRRVLKSIAPKPKLRRTGHITIRLSAEERAQLEERSARAGLMIGSYVRQAVFNAPMPRQVRRPAVDRAELARLLGQLGYIGNNINQIARVLNGGGEADQQLLFQALGDLHLMRDAALEALGRAP